MRVMVFSIPGEEFKEGMEPTPEMMEAFAAMDAFTEELVQAGVFVAAAGLKPASESKRVEVDNGKRTVIDGPFAEAREMVAGFSIWEVRDMDEAMAWAMRAPAIGKGAMEIRPFYEAADLGDFVSEEEMAAPRDGDRGKLGVA
ncbi:YciI family protein [Stakelama tenebrarum]|uniref:YciI family protein n=1 Tax=Stakelama tenebrarum TaxID=2711215 RepID=A0A6G6Y8M4_9SPHN|nr:YciI family protein [Sphingosinithalassobacter tenebrarum]QIG81292.1 YciI family protein [Sphingosinithalassobacter tenebrarum]